MFPAKYSFDIDAAPNCANDYVVFGLNVAGSAGQANLLGLNQLYRGTGGLCGTGTANVNWAYNGSTAGGTGPNLAGNFSRWYENRLCGKRCRTRRSFTSLHGRREKARPRPRRWPRLSMASAPQPVRASNRSPSPVPLRQPLPRRGSTTPATRHLWEATMASFTASVVSSIVLSTLSPQWTGLSLCRWPARAVRPRHPTGRSTDSQTGHLIVGDQLGELWTINAERGEPFSFCWSGNDRRWRLHNRQTTRTQCDRNGLCRERWFIRYPGFRHS